MSFNNEIHTAITLIKIYHYIEINIHNLPRDFVTNLNIFLYIYYIYFFLFIFLFYLSV